MADMDLAATTGALNPDALPDLHQALYELVDFIKVHVPILKDNPLIEDAEAALAKADHTKGPCNGYLRG